MESLRCDKARVHNFALLSYSQGWIQGRGAEIPPHSNIEHHQIAHPTSSSLRS